MSDDPTVNRCTARAYPEKFGRLEVINLFALRSADSDELAGRPDPVGPGGESDAAVIEATASASIVIWAWGAHPAAISRAKEIVRLLGEGGMRDKLYHLGLNRGGSPKPPLYVAASTRLHPFTPND